MRVRLLASRQDLQPLSETAHAARVRGLRVLRSRSLDRVKPRLDPDRRQHLRRLGVDQLAATMADVLAEDGETADLQSFPRGRRKAAICSGNEDSVEKTVRCANPMVVRAASLSLL